jgi:serine/threonine-protein kinase
VNTPADPLVGRRFGQVRLEAFVARGPVGTVYRGHHEVSRREVAVRLLTPGHPAASLQRFLRETRLASQVRHPNVAQVIESGDSAGQVYLVVELVPGDDLGQRLQRLQPGGRLEGSVALRIGADAAAGLAAIHQHGVLHRGLAPDCVLIPGDGSAKIGDLGLAACLREVEDEQRILTGQPAASPRYLAPECIADPRSALPASDVYALGATLYHAFAGRPPFDGADAAAITEELRAARPTPLREIRPDVDAAVEEMVMRCLAKDPAGRPAAAALAESLARKLGKPPAGASRAPRSRSVIEPFS